MRILMYISQCMVPIIIFYIVATGIATKQDVYKEFITGAKDGLKTVVQIAPTLIGLMVGVGILRASGFLDMLSELIGRLSVYIHFPAQLVPLAIVKMFSSSAATGLLIDLYKQYGTDSSIGVISSIMMSCTETIFYTVSVYYMAAKVKKTRWTITGALVATFVGIIASVIIAGLM